VQEAHKTLHERVRRLEGYMRVSHYRFDRDVPLILLKSAAVCVATRTPNRTQVVEHVQTAMALAAEAPVRTRQICTSPDFQGCGILSYEDIRA
jgi:hypothetical protein